MAASLGLILSFSHQVVTLPLTLPCFLTSSHSSHSIVLLEASPASLCPEFSAFYYFLCLFYYFLYFCHPLRVPQCWAEHMFALHTMVSYGADCSYARGLPQTQFSVIWEEGHITLSMVHLGLPLCWDPVSCLTQLGFEVLWTNGRREQGLGWRWSRGYPQ